MCTYTLIGCRVMLNNHEIVRSLHASKLSTNENDRFTLKLSEHMYLDSAWLSSDAEQKRNFPKFTCKKNSTNESARLKFETVRTNVRLL